MEKAWAGPSPKVSAIEGRKLATHLATDRKALTETGLDLPREGILVVDLPEGSAEYQRRYPGNAVHGEPAELLGASVSIEDTQAIFQILRLPAAPSMPFLLRTSSPSIACTATEGFGIHDSRQTSDGSGASFPGGSKGRPCHGEGASLSSTERHPRGRP